MLDECRQYGSLVEGISLPNGGKLELSLQNQNRVCCRKPQFETNFQQSPGCCLDVESKKQGPFLCFTGRKFTNKS
ncbi:MAG: hypothetical protein Ct9H300mP21_09450 [Pseudomonadota bacterium]|nr:MAG: hypothetical protein Ct9H300mP21_09450 [Pseudomonadota bacterium]